MGISATELGEVEVQQGGEQVPEGKKLAGRSPTQIALDRLRKDKLAVVCTAIVVVMAVLFSVTGTNLPLWYAVAEYWSVQTPVYLKLDAASP